MMWNDTEDKLVFSSVIARARAAFPKLSDPDWIAAKGQRSALVTLVAQSEGISDTRAEFMVARFEESLNYNRYAF